MKPTNQRKRSPLAVYLSALTIAALTNESAPSDKRKGRDSRSSLLSNNGSERTSALVR